MELKTRMLRPPLTVMLVASFFASLLAGTDSVNIRLVNGHDFCSGRVEVYVDDQWGTVCDDGWDLNDAEVVCRQLGCGKALRAHSSASFGKGSGPIHLNNVGCSGKESIITECHHDGFKKHNCGHGEDAGVTCTVKGIRLLNGKNPCCGKVEINRKDQWGTVCDDDWNMNDAAVVCRELGCGKAVSALHTSLEQGRGLILLRDFNCFGGESAISECFYKESESHNCSHGKYAGVVCSGDLQSPMLFLNSSQFVGEAVQFRCIAPFPTCIPVDFKLYRNGESIKTQTAEFSTTFNLTVDSSHQGQYSCDYSFQGNSSITSSKSNSVDITVASLAPFISSGVAAGLFLILVAIIIFFVKRCKSKKTQMIDYANMDSEGEYFIFKIHL
uniref:SRCR domain-containing protein n=1 Tax=Pygocentrus nattereri TaxID=42514 RepID=A0A3B4DJK5_PYGNA